MAIFDAGIFILMSAVGFIFFLIKFQDMPFYRWIAVILFGAMAFPLISGYEIAYTTTITGGNCTPSCSVVKDLISNNTAIFGVVLGGIYLLFAIINMILFFQEYFEMMQRIADKVK